MHLRGLNESDGEVSTAARLVWLIVLWLVFTCCLCDIPIDLV